MFSRAVRQGVNRLNPTLRKYTSVMTDNVQAETARNAFVVLWKRLFITSAEYKRNGNDRTSAKEMETAQVRVTAWL